MTKSKYVIVLVLFLVIKTGYGQSSDSKKTTTPANDKSEVPILTADSLATGNYKDILLSFYQLAVNNLTGANKELKFSSNPYAIMLKNNPNLKKFDEYKRYQLWRRFNFTVDAKLDSAYRFNGFATAVIYSIVNRRDFTLRENFVTAEKNANNDTMFTRLSEILGNKLVNEKTFLIYDDLFRQSALKSSGLSNSPDAAALDKAFEEQRESFINIKKDFAIERERIDGLDVAADEKNSLNDTNTKNKQTKISGLMSTISSQLNDSTTKAKLANYYVLYDRAKAEFIADIKKKVTAVFSDETLTFDKIEPNVRTWIFHAADSTDSSIIYLRQLLAKDPKLIVAKKLHEDYDALVASFSKKGLWTASVNDTSYSDGRLFKTVQFNSEYLKGFYSTNCQFNLELDIKGSINFTDDSLLTGRNLSRQFWTFEPGVNLVLKGKQSHKSFFEFKLSGGISHTFKGQYANEKTTDITLNANVRLRIFNEVWIPFQIKYDPKSGNVFGFLNITTNFTGLGSLLKGKK